MSHTIARTMRPRWQSGCRRRRRRPQAQVYVGEIFEKGLGRPADLAEAARWYEKAAAQNFARGQMNLAYCTSSLGVEKDPLKALNLYRRPRAYRRQPDVRVGSRAGAQRDAGRHRRPDSAARNAEREVGRLKSELEASQTQLSSQRVALARHKGRVAICTAGRGLALSAGAIPSVLPNCSGSRRNFSAEQKLATRNAPSPAWRRTPRRSVRSSPSRCVPAGT